MWVMLTFTLIERLREREIESKKQRERERELFVAEYRATVQYERPQTV